MTMVISNRTRPRQELRADIYETALALFRARGFAATPVDEIVAAAGVAKGTFFNFFPSKVDVLKAYYRNIDLEVARHRADLDPAAPRRSLLRYARAVERILRREGPLMLELLEYTFADPSLRRIDEDSGALDTDEFELFFVNACGRGQIAAHIHPRAAAEALIDLWSGAVRAWMRDPEGLSLAKLFDARVATLHAGLAP